MKLVFEFDACLHFDFWSSSILCSYLLMSVDNEEFYEQQRPLSLPDIVQLVSILKEVSAGVLPLEVMI